MTNINAFYPDRLKGWALGINAGGGNLGVAGGAAGRPAGAGHRRRRAPAASWPAIYIPLIVLAALGAALYMDNLTPGPQREARHARRRPASAHTWIMSLLYIGTFGSFIGFGFAFGQVLQVQFPDEFSTPVKAAYLTFLGPLLGSLIRPVGGALADRLGGARVTFWNFIAMAVGAASCCWPLAAASLPLYLVGFIALFVFSGIGNGSTYKMIPAIFQAKASSRYGRATSPSRPGRAGCPAR